MNGSRLPALWSLEGQRALVVGGGGGIGVAICEHLAERGASIAVAGRSVDKAGELVAGLSRYGAPAAAYTLDVTDRDSVRWAVSRMAAEWSGIDILVNCASRLITTPAERFSPEDWREVVETNLTGAFWLSQEVGGAMIRTGTAGRMIHLSSVRSAAGGRHGFSAYGASKAGLNLLVKQLATEWGRHGVTVNAVAPGFVRTDFVENASQDQRFLQMLLQRIPLGRFAEAEDIAGAVLYLASPVARFVTGQVLFVDGGVTASH
jgi:NAD(P)-dependent dehydrogenase (short-subunit alcohol dehydrogenase family)